MAFEINSTEIITDSRIITNAAIVLVGSATSTGTANQRLQVQGGASFVGLNSSIGIGATNPGAKLDIAVSGDGTKILKFSTERAWSFLQQSTGASTGLELNSEVDGKGFRITSPDRSSVFRVDTFNADANNFVYMCPDGGIVGIATAISTGTASQALQVNSGGYFNGLVGIGITRPTSVLHVIGNSLFNGIVTATSFFGSGANLTSLTGATPGTYGNSSNTPQIVVDANGRITSITQVAVSGAGGTGVLGVNVFDNTSSLGITTILNFRNSLSVTSLGSTLAIDVIPQWMIGASGIGTVSNVGIGTTNPTQRLDVLGNSIFRGSLELSQNPNNVGFGTTIGLPSFYIGQTMGDNDFWRIYGESPGGTNSGHMVFEVNDDVDNSERFLFRTKRTYTSIGGTSLLELTQSGNIIQNVPLLIGAATSTGTANQRLQVTGESYFSSDVGIGTTNPSSQLHITGQFQSTQANSTATGGGQIYLNGATGNRIDFSTSGVGTPTFSTRSVGTKIVLYPQVGVSDVDYAIGIANNTLWYSVPNTSPSATHRWYAGIATIAELRGSGELLLGYTSLTGTANQRLQVNGGAYFADDIGIGITNPAITLQIQNSNSTYSNPQSTNVPVVHCYNASNASTTAHAILGARVGGANGGDPFISFDVNGVGGWSLGLDNSDNDSFKISRSWSDLGTGTNFTIDTNGDIGIGTANPTFKMHVQGTGFFQTSVNTDSTTFGVFDANATTINGFGSATTMTLGFDGLNASSTTNINSAVTASGFIKTINIGTNSGAGSTVNINIGSGMGAGSTSTVTIGSPNGYSRAVIQSSAVIMPGPAQIGDSTDQTLRGPIVSFVSPAKDPGEGYRDGVHNFTVLGGLGGLAQIQCSVGGGVIRSITTTPAKEGRGYAGGNEITVGIPSTTIPIVSANGDGTYVTATFAPQVQLATTAATGTGTTATLTFATQTLPPYPPNSTITVSNVIPAGYNGTYTVTACTTTTVSYANATIGAQTQAGTVSIHPFVNGLVTVTGLLPVGLNTTDGVIAANSATNVTYLCAQAGSASGVSTAVVQQGNPVISGIVTVSTVRRAGINIFNSTFPRIRLENTTTSVSTGTELGSILFGCRDANTGGSGDKGRIVAVAEGSSGGATIQFYTSANAGEPTLCAAFGGLNDFRLYNIAGTFYHTFANEPTVNRTITLPDYNFTVASQNVAETITGIKTFTARPNFATGIAVTSIVSTVPGIALSTTNAPGIVAFTSGAIGIAITADIASNYATIIHNDGNATTRLGMRLLCGTDDASGSNTAIAFDSGNGTNQGSISFTSGTVTYGAFTANHDCIIPSYSEQIPYGSLMTIKKILYKKNSNGDELERGILYEAGISTVAYAKNLLGAYSGEYDSTAPVQQVNDHSVHQVLVLGDGHIRCCGENGNINLGDGITSSSMEGVGMKMNKIGVVIGLAQENVVFDDPSDVKLVPVQYGLHQYIPDNISDYIETLMSS